MALLLRSSRRQQSYLVKQLMCCSYTKNRGFLPTNGKSIFETSRTKNISLSSIAQAEVATQQAHEPKTKVHKLAVGDELNGFKVVRVEPVPEFSLVAVKLVHEPTKAEYLHIDRDDSNNTFSVLFRTTPTNSTGLPHILEHTTLCGSEKYPCRNPFFNMLNRSLSSFMNAMTAPDWTMYPFLTQNSKDYKNLMSVYLDAVFRPLLKESDFKQEGWHLEHTDPNDPKTPIIIKGVVFNEMKGIFSDNQNIFQEALQNNILPSHTYSVCSGGDPIEIPNLTHTDLKNFHKQFYSPFNAKYYSYGNIPVSEHIQFISEEYLNNLNLNEKGSLSTGVPPEKRWTEPKHKHIKCRPDPLAANKNKQSSIAISHLCCSITDVQECFTLKILSELLTSGPNSSFYKTLIEPNIGSGFSPVTGFENETRDTCFTVALQGVAEEDFSRISQIYEDTIDGVIANGFDSKHLESILHSIELHSKHQSSNFGLELLFAIASTWNHDGDVIDFLKIEKKLKTFRKKLAEDPKYLQKKVQEYLKDNKHKLVLTMSPDQQYEAERKEKEEKLLESKLKELDEEAKRKIYEDGLRLLEEQKVIDKDCLPTLSIRDLNKDIHVDMYYDKEISKMPFRLIPQPTNGITYFRGILNVKDLAEEDRVLLPLFALISTKMGTTKNNFKDFHKLVSSKTGGLSLETHFIQDIKGMNRFEESLTTSSYCLNKNLNDMFKIWLELFQDMELSDVNRFETLIKAEAADLGNGIVRMGHRYAMLSASSLISGVEKLKEQRGGLSYLDLVTQVSKSPPEEVLKKMKNIRSAVVSNSQMRFAANILEGTEDAVMKSAATFVDNISGSPGKPNNFQYLPPMQSEYNGVFHVLPIQINFAAKCTAAVPFEHEDFAPLRVLTRLLTMKFLHPEIREKAGAYGCGLNLCQGGLLNFFSYSDPNPANSLQIFDKCASWLLEKNFNQSDVDEAKLGIFQSVDAPVPPGSRGMKEFLLGVSNEALRRHRLQLMKVTMDELIEIGVKYLDETKNSNPVGRAVIGQENKSIIENSSQKWNVIKRD